MCQGCLDAVEKYFPRAKDEEVHDLLWNHTAFPFADAKHIEKQLREVKHRMLIGACTLCGRLPEFSHGRYCFNTTRPMFEESNPFTGEVVENETNQ